MYIPENKILEILNACDIVDVISEYVILKKSGINYFGLCPFHSEKTPSFSVSPQKQIFHCFGCGAGGNVFSFLMKHHGISFPEAARMAAKRYSIEFENISMTPGVKKKLELKEGLFRLNNKVMKYYADFLKKSLKASAARHYLEKRGITSEIQELFYLGYAMDNWSFMVNFLKKMHLSRDFVEASGLVLKNKRENGYYDRFRNRIIFPIIDVNMQVAGFGGRVMDDGMPKYLNSPETPVYSKSRILYGLYLSKQHCRQKDSVYIVEGYFDFLSLYQHGVKNTVASLGTALTSEHIRLLKGYASKMVLVFDSDNAGINAAKRSITTFLQHGIDFRIIVLPKGHDPDSFIREYGRQAFEKAGDAAMAVIPFLTEIAVRKYGLSVEGKISILNDMKLHLAVIEDSAARSLYIRELSEKLGIDERAVLEKVRNVQNNGIGNISIKSLDLKKHDSGSMEEKSLESDRRELQVLSMMLQYPEIIPTVRSKNVLDFFYSDRFKRIGRLIQNIDNSEADLIAEVMTNVSNDADRELIASLVMMEIPGTEHLLEKSVSLMERIIKVKSKSENLLANKIRKAEQNGNADLPFELLKQRQMEIRQLHGYK